MAQQRMVYQWRPKRELPIDAQVAGEELEKLKEENGGELDPAEVVEAARNRRSPLHSVFEWNDGRAAQQYRLQQARGLISSLIVTVVSEGGEGVDEVSVSVKRTAARQAEGQSTARVFTADELSAQRVKKGWSEIEHWLASYGSLPEFAPMAMALQGFVAARDAAKKKGKAAA